MNYELRMIHNVSELRLTRNPLCIMNYELCIMNYELTHIWQLQVSITQTGRYPSYSGKYSFRLY